MAYMKTLAIEAYEKKMQELSAKAEEQICGKAIYKGAKEIADKIRAGIDALPTDNRFLKGPGMLSGPSAIQKKGLQHSLGITSMEDDGFGFLNVKVGFDGYNMVRTKRWPKGQPNPMVARSVERGTSFMAAHPVFKWTVFKYKKKILNILRQEVDREIEKIMKG